MFKLVDSLDSKYLCGTDPFCIRISSLYKAYGGTNVCSFYTDTETGSVMALNGSVLIYDGDKISDTDELNMFCSALGADTVLCNDALKFNNTNKSSGYILKLAKLPQLKVTLQVIFNENLKELYSILCDNMQDEISKIPFEYFYTDLSHKVRHNCAETATGFIDNAPVSCAVAPFISKAGAIISSVCTKKSMRHMGLGSAVLYSLAEKLILRDIDNIYLYIDNSKLIEFYSRLGFAVWGKWQEIYLS